MKKIHLLTLCLALFSASLFFTSCSQPSNDSGNSSSSSKTNSSSSSDEEEKSNNFEGRTFSGTEKYTDDAGIVNTITLKVNFSSASKGSLSSKIEYEEDGLTVSNSYSLKFDYEANGNTAEAIADNGEEWTFKIVGSKLSVKDSDGVSLGSFSEE